MKNFSNDAVNLQLKLTAEIGELLKARNVNISYLEVKVSMKATKKEIPLIGEKSIVEVKGDIKITFDSILNPETQKFEQFENLDDDDLFK